jgi:glycerol-3-phosphate dehydrogenase
VTAPRWSLPERRSDLERAEREGVDLLIVGGGITGAGVVRDAASRGLRALLVERDDFAAGTSSRSSKMIHGGLRYLAQGQLAMTREACRERDLLMQLNPHLVRPIPFLFPAYEGGRYSRLEVRVALSAYAAMANFRRSARFRMLDPEEVAGFSRDLRQEGLRGAGLYCDGQVDDARLVLESLRGARRLGAAVVNHAEVTEFLREAEGALGGARVRDRLGGGSYVVRSHVVVNAAGAAVDRVRGLDRPVERPELRPAKGVHLVVPRSRVHVSGTITFEASDRRQLFLSPWDDVAFIGTTDSFSDEIEEPVVTIEEVHYLLEAANQAFPRAGLTTNDIRSVWAGVRPLIASPDEPTPSSSVSRDHRIYEDASGLISVAGGKLTTYRATGEAVVQRALRRLPRERRRAAGPSRTASLALREDGFDFERLVQSLRAIHGLSASAADHLVRTHGADAEAILAEAPAAERTTIGSSRYTFAEIRWAMQREAAFTLCDLLERRMRLALFAVGQGLPELDAIARIAGEAAGWDDDRVHAEAADYAHCIRRRYQIQAAAPKRHAA